MIKNETPCRKCRLRRLGCHSECEAYNDWRILFDMEKDRINKAKQEYYQTLPNEIKRKRFDIL